MKYYQVKTTFLHDIEDCEAGEHVASEISSHVAANSEAATETARKKIEDSNEWDSPRDFSYTLLQDREIPAGKILLHSGRAFDLPHYGWLSDGFIAVDKTYAHTFDDVTTNDTKFLGGMEVGHRLEAPSATETDCGTLSAEFKESSFKAEYVDAILGAGLHIHDNGGKPAQPFPICGESGNLVGVIMPMCDWARR